MARLWRGLVWLVRLELQMYGGLARLLRRRPDVPDGATPHRYVGAVSLLLWVITGVSAVELVVLHLVLPWESVRIAADVLGVWGVVWCAGLTACHYVYPHLADREGLRIRSAHRTPVVEVPWASVAGTSLRERSVESGRRSLHVDDQDVLHVAVASRTNVELRLREPVAVSNRGELREVVEVRFFADDPRAVRAQIIEIG